MLVGTRVSEQAGFLEQHTLMVEHAASTVHSPLSCASFISRGALPS